MKHRLSLPGILIAVLPMIARGEPPVAKPDSFDSNGVKIAYVTAGDGEPVLLVHGLYSSAELNWQLPGIFRQLAEHHQVVALDLRGHGKSEKPTGDDDYGKPMVDDLVRLMDHLKIKKAHIVGYSLGGIIAMKFAVDHPDRVRSVALGGMGWLKEGSPQQIAWEKLPGRSAGLTPPACVHAMAKLAITEDQLKAVKVPVEMLVGDHDPCKKLYVDPAHAARSDWPVVVVPDAGHITCVTKDQFKQGLLDWLEKNASKAKS